ncbi:actin-3-like isoform X2 [Hylaeus volcanicus]|uniref:actin-3-like isoform X2 n=1 Tax=Hylaeus volcanicus TaxID=313075 RepID=UPI0023B7AAEC|nr:actin-3-like isoform X2 [Hylaeus volcanicus]
MASGVVNSSIVLSPSSKTYLFPLDPKEVMYDTDVIKPYVYDSSTQTYKVEDEDALKNAIVHSMKPRAVSPSSASTLSTLPLLLPESAKTDRNLRNCLASILFSSLECEGIFFSKQPVLATYGCGQTSALVWDSGYSRTTSSVVLQGYTLQSTIIETPIGGCFFNKEILSLFQDKQVVYPFYAYSKKPTMKPFRETFITQSYWDWSLECMVEDIKRQLSFNRSENDFVKSKNGISYQLPDNTFIDTSQLSHVLDPLVSGNHQETCENLLSEMSSDGKLNTKDWSCSCMMLESLNRANKEKTSKVKSHLNSIVVTGGNTMFSGFFSKFQKEVHTQLESYSNLKILYPPQKHLRRHTVFIGSSILTCLASFQDFLVTRSEYEEHGDTIFDKKCP